MPSAVPPSRADPFRWMKLTVLALLVLWSWTFRGPLAAAAVADSVLHVPNLVFHEAGHVIMMPLGEFMTALGGSLFQVLVPLVCAAVLLRQNRDAFGAAIMVWWAGQNLVDLSPYIADARALRLVLLGGRTGAEVEGHDWEYLLTALGWIHLDVRIGRATHVAGLLVMGGAIVWGAVAALRPTSREDASVSQA